MKIPPFSQQEQVHEEYLYTLYAQYRNEYRMLLKNRKLSLQEITRIRNFLYESFLYFSTDYDLADNKNTKQLVGCIELSKY